MEKKHQMTLAELYHNMYTILEMAMLDGLDLLKQGDLKELRKTMKTALRESEDLWLNYDVFTPEVDELLRKISRPH